jgi:hypothetical protein
MTDEQFTQVLEAAEFAQAVAWDGCHKIYLALDDDEARFFADNYEHYVDARSREDMARQVAEWKNESCALGFGSSVRHDEEDPNAGFTDIIPQFA